MYCKYCGEQIPDDSVICFKCGRQVAEIKAQQPQVVIHNNNVNTNTNVNRVDTERPYNKVCSKWKAFFLCLFFGYIGAHKFYEGKVGMGLLYLFTLGLCGFGWAIDTLVLLFKPNPYYV